MLKQSQDSIPIPDNFIQNIKQFTFQQKYFKWKQYLLLLKQHSSQYYQASLQKFIQYYPFNHTYWIQLLNLILKMPKGKTNTHRMYQIALAKNPRCIVLWKKYLDWLKKQITKNDPNYLKQQIENSVKIVGNHFKAAFVFQYYCQLETNLLKKYHMLKKAMVSPLQDIDRIKQFFMTLIDSQQFSSTIMQIAQSQGMPLQQGGNIQQAKRILNQQIKRKINTLYQPTKQHILQRQIFEKKILTDQYIPYTDSIENWRQYIAFIKQSGNNEFLPSVYERALISQCDNGALWEQYLLLLENQGNHQRALYLLRFHSLFFRNLSKQLTYYWLQLQQRDNPSYSRQLYLKIQQTQYDLQIFMRHIQLELRSKQFNNAKAIYQTVLTAFTTNLPIVTHTVIQFADFTVRYFRDIQSAKKLLQTYFKSYPFNEYLFIGLLQFYQKNIEYKQGTKQAKQIADQYIEYLLLGLKKAMESVDNKQYKRIKKVSNYRMRAYILSIYLIKGAQRKIKQQEFQIKKNQQLNQQKIIHQIQHNSGIDQPVPQKKIDS